MPTIYDRITCFNKGRLPDMLKLKYKAMAFNVFTFYRGTCHLFYEDLAAARPLPGSPVTWICGDLHIENFGSFKGDDRLEYFDLNDFDESLLAPAAWEVVRMVTSILVAFESLGLKKAEGIKVARIFLNSYSSNLKNGKALSIDSRTAKGIVYEFLCTVKKRKQKELLKRLAVSKKGKFTSLLIDGRHFELEAVLKQELLDYLNNHIRTITCMGGNYTALDCVFRLAGTGSIGVKRYLFLLKNQDTKGKYLLLDMKQSLSSSLKPYVKIKQPKWGSESARVIAVQERMQNVPPALLNSLVFKDEPYVLKQMQPIADKINFELIKDQYAEIDRIISDMAMLTASAQLRSGGRQGSAITDALIAFGENNQWDEDIFKYARQYTSQVKKDYTAFLDGFNKGLYQ